MPSRLYSAIGFLNSLAGAVVIAWPIVTRTDTQLTVVTGVRYGFNPELQEMFKKEAAFRAGGPRHGHRGFLFPVPRGDAVVVRRPSDASRPIHILRPPNGHCSPSKAACAVRPSRQGPASRLPQTLSRENPVRTWEHSIEGAQVPARLVSSF